MPKYLGTGGKETKYNVDYVTTGSILKEFCGFLQLFAVNCLLIYSKIYIANVNSESLINIFPIFAPKLRNRSQVSQNCTTPTCIIMQLSINVCIHAESCHLPMEITCLKVFIRRKYKHKLVIWLHSCIFHISKPHTL